MSETWWLISGPNGDSRQVVTDGETPSDAGEDVTNKSVVMTDRRGDPSIETVKNGKWVVDLDVLKDKLLAQIDSQREQRQMEFLTRGNAKSMVYTQKAKEVVDYKDLDAAVLADLSLASLRQRFPAAMAEVDLTGTPLATVIANVEAASAAANAKVWKIEALTQKAKTAVKAATTEAAARAAANINWAV